MPGSIFFSSLWSFVGVFLPEFLYIFLVWFLCLLGIYYDLYCGSVFDNFCSPKDICLFSEDLWKPGVRPPWWLLCHSWICPSTKWCLGKKVICSSKPDHVFNIWIMLAIFTFACTRCIPSPIPPLATRAARNHPPPLPRDPFPSLTSHLGLFGVISVLSHSSLGRFYDTSSKLKCFLRQPKFWGF